MAKFRKKPIVIEAVQWVGNEDEMPIPPVDHRMLRQRGKLNRRWQLKTLEGWYTLTPNDWIITGIQNELYPCKPDIFDATYEPALIGSRNGPAGS